MSLLFADIGAEHYNTSGGLHMTIETLLSGLSTSEKLEAMDFLWRDLSKAGDSYESPEWHGSVLADRLANPSTGASLPLADAIKDVKERLNARRTER
ncbi:MAG: addiction module protein [Planctomycetota bacterium]|nr:addiction module protein [Planctomycetota bacterium]